MALRVPKVTGPSVEERALTGGFQRSSASAETLGGGAARQLADAGRALIDVGVQLQERDDADTLMRVESDLKQRYLEWESEAKQRVGENARGVTAEARKWWDENTRKARNELKNPRQSAMLDRVVAPLATQSVGVLSNFEQVQRRHSLAEAAQASVVGSINLAAANPTDPTVLQTSKSDILKRHAVLAQLNGWAPEMATAKRAEYLTNFHKQVIQGLVRADPVNAQAYFEANKGEIEGSQHAEVGAFAARATATRIGDATAEEIWATAGPKNDRDPVTLDTMEAALRKRLGANDEAVKAGIAGLRERAAAFKDSRRERDDQLEAQVNAAILNGAGSRQIRSMPAFLSLSPESARKIADFLDNRAVRQEQIAAARESRADAAESREERRKNRDTFAAYLTYSNPDTLAGMTEAQVLNLLPSLGNEHTKQLMQKKRELAKPEKLAEAKMDKDDFDRVSREIGLAPDDGRPLSPEQRAQLGELHFRVEQVIDSTQRRTGKNLTRPEKLDLMRREMAAKVTVDTWGPWNKDVPVILLKPDQVRNVMVPPADRSAIVQAMTERYRQTKKPEFEPTEENVRRWYLLGKSRAAGMIDGR